MALCLILTLWVAILVAPTALTAWRDRGKAAEIDGDQPASVEDAARRAGL